MSHSITLDSNDTAARDRLPAAKSVRTMSSRPHCSELTLPNRHDPCCTARGCTTLYSWVENTFCGRVYDLQTMAYHCWLPSARLCLPQANHVIVMSKVTEWHCARRGGMLNSGHVATKPSWRLTPIMHPCWMLSTAAAASRSS